MNRECGTATMGILNVTPDSFFDGGRYLGLAAQRRFDQIVGEGAVLIDIGGESTRPGASPVSAEEQIGRLTPLLEHAKTHPHVLVSVDTSDPLVADRMLSMGADAINDISCLRDLELARVVARHGASLIIMHSRGPMSNMSGFSEYPEDAYGDVCADVAAEWRVAAARAEVCGLPRDAILFDPGIGFAKNARQSEELLLGLSRFSDLGVPIVVGPGRKSFLRRVADVPPDRRLGATVVACLLAAERGAAVVRVHDVEVVRQALAAHRHFGGCSPRHAKEEAACTAAS